VEVLVSSAPWVGDLVTGAVGIAGVLLGLFMDRLIQRYGKVRCVMDPIEIWVFPSEGLGEPTILRSLPIPAELLPESLSEREYSSEVGRCFLKVTLFNEKEVRTGLQDVVVAFERKRPMEKTLLDKSTQRNTTQLLQTTDTLEAVNLPSREWITFSLVGDLELEEARKLTECDRAWLRGYFPGGRRFNKRVPFAK
jgi:hypothetical protein